VRRFEAGRCSADEFAAGVVGDWQLDIAPAAFLEQFGGWANDPFPGALELVAAVRDDVGLGCLSNTNAVQWHARYEATPLTEAFEFRFLSFELGMVKPDREIFEEVAARLAVPPGRILFLDDNAANVTAAEATGFVGRHVRGVDEARQALALVGVLSG
jgi:putative hydrolase of the HAD superfamily